MDIFEALSEVASTENPIVVIFSDPNQWEEFVKLTTMSGFQNRENKVKLYYKMTGQSVVLGEKIDF